MLFRVADLSVEWFVVVVLGSALLLYLFSFFACCLSWAVIADSRVAKVLVNFVLIAKVNLVERSHVSRLVGWLQNANLRLSLPGSGSQLRNDVFGNGARRFL